MTPRAAAFVSAWTPCRHALVSHFCGRQAESFAFIAARRRLRDPLHSSSSHRRQIFTLTAGGGNGVDGENDKDAGIIHADLRQEMSRSYMEYAMSVILGRAMPDVRDGLKPVHRRILFAMHELGLSPKSSFRKSARVVGEVLGKYHPHGDTAVYDALVRMAQNFSMSTPLVNGHGNFGSTDGDPAAAMRYTECKLSLLTGEAFLEDLDRDTVSFVPNFDGSEQEPLVLPVKIPNLLVNGSSGIAVGMATNIPPHNLGEVVAAVKAMIAQPDISDEELFSLVPAPDFPTGGLILGTDGARDMYRTGKGRITVRACAHAELLGRESSKRKARDAIVVTELPYQVNKATLVAKIAELVNDKKLDGISDLRDESDRYGTRIVIELKRDAKVPVVLNNLYKKTYLQSSFSGNVMALDNGRFPLLLSLRDCLEKFLQFRRETIRRRVRYDLKKAEDRLHIVEGLLVVQNSVDGVVSDIRNSEDTADARLALMKNYELSEIQANSVLEMQLRRLTSLELKRLENEQDLLVGRTTDFRSILATPQRIDEIITEELTQTASKHSWKRRSKIVNGSVEDMEIDDKELIPNDGSVITVTRQGYIKRMPTAAFDSQNRGTRGKRGVGRLRAGDKMAHLFSCMTHDSLVVIATTGRAYLLEAYKVPVGGLASRGVPLLELLPVPAGETIATVLPVSEDDEGHLLLQTKSGYLKKLSLEDVRSIRTSGRKVILLGDGDELRFVKKCESGDSICIITERGKLLRFPTDEKTLRASGRSSRGVNSIRLVEGDAVVDMDVIPRTSEGEEPFVLFVTNFGTGKRVRAKDFRAHGRRTQGNRAIKLGKGEKLVAAQTCGEGDGVMLVTSGGTVVRMSLDMIPVQSRHSHGVKMQRLGGADRVAAVVVLDSEHVKGLVDIVEEGGEGEEGGAEGDRDAEILQPAS